MTQQPNRQEVGYILLEECEVLIDDRTCRSSTRPYSKNPESGVWYDVDLQSTPEIHQGKGASEFPNGSSSDACDLVLRPCANFEAVSDQSINNEKQDSSKCTIMWKSATEILPFNGLLSEMIINSSSILTSSNENSNSQGTDAAASAPKKDYASSQEHESKTNENIANNTSPTSSKTRSDASLLAGLAVEINRQGHLFTRQKDDLHSSSTHDKAGGIIASKGGSIIEGGNLRFLQIENASIMFLEEKPIQESHMNSHFVGEKNEESSSASTLHPCEKLMRMRASFLITFSLPVRGCNNGSLHIDERNNTNNSQTMGENFVSSSKEKAKARIKDTILSSAYQLLGSIIRCDWNHLENRVKNIQQCAVAQRNLDKPASSDRASSLLSQNDQYNSPKDGRAIPLRETTSSRPEQQHHSRQSFFPASLSVEELYVRISGASKHFGSEMRENSTHNKLNASTFTNRAGYSPAINTTCDSTFSRMSKTLEEDVVGIFHLPKDVIVTSIATYLRARSLHALRSTNRRMYKALCTVVPGLKLQLFRHQIRSLEWMERRERHCITEAEVIRKREGSNQASPTTADSFLREGEAVCGGDYHRAITGGETILLAPRPNDKGRDKQELLRFDSKTGTPVMMANTEIKTNTSLLNHCSRRAARGGLVCPLRSLHFEYFLNVLYNNFSHIFCVHQLCDDPGLGKCIRQIDYEREHTYYIGAD